MDYTVKVTDVAVWDFVEGQNHFLWQLRHDLYSESMELLINQTFQHHLSPGMSKSNQHQYFSVLCAHSHRNPQVNSSPINQVPPFI